MPSQNRISSVQSQPDKNKPSLAETDPVTEVSPITNNNKQTQA